MKNIWYYDVESGQVKTAHHVSFDESMSDLSDKPPNARMLVNVSTNALDPVDFSVETPDLDVSTTPFFHLRTFSMPFDPMAAESLFLSFRLCQRLRRVYISDFHLAPTELTLRSARRQLLGSYVISIDDTPIFRIDDIQRLLLRYSSQDHPPATLLVTVAPERASDFDDRPPPLHLRLHDLRHIAALQSLDGVGTPIDVEPSSSGHLRMVLNAFKADLHDIDMAQFVH